MMKKWAKNPSLGQWAGFEDLSLVAREYLGMPGVYAAGTKAKNSAGLPSNRAFWVRHFKTCVAIMDKADYGRALIGITG